MFGIRVQGLHLHPNSYTPGSRPESLLLQGRMLGGVGRDARGPSSCTPQHLASQHASRGVFISHSNQTTAHVLWQADLRDLCCERQGARGWVVGLVIPHTRTNKGCHPGSNRRYCRTHPRHTQAYITYAGSTDRGLRDPSSGMPTTKVFADQPGWLTAHANRCRAAAPAVTGGTAAVTGGTAENTRGRSLHRHSTNRGWF